MINSIFFVYCGLFIFAYGVQGALQARYIRKYDSLTVGLYRNLSLIVTMAPLLLFVPLEETLKILNLLPLLCLASITGAIGLLGAFASAHYLPIGVGTALRQMTHTIAAVLLGAYLFSEFLGPFQLLFLGFAGAAGFMLILSKIDYGHLNPHMVGRGIVLALLSGVVVAVSFYYFSALSRQVHPFTVSYFWEAGIGISLLAYLFFLKLWNRTALQLPTKKDALAIIAIALLTIIGTAGYAFAVINGPFALASGLMNLTTLVAVVLGPYLFNEKLSRYQLGLVIAAVLCTIFLRLVS